MKSIVLQVGAIALVLLACAYAGADPALAQRDQYGTYAMQSDTVNAPCRRWSAIVPSDSTDLAELPKAVYVGGGGDLTMIGVDAPAEASGVAWSNVPSASILPVRPRRVLATGTTATLIVGCY